MAGYPNPEFKMLDQLRRDGWSIYDMAEFEPKIMEIVTWCRETFGNMLTIYEWDIIDCTWHGTTISNPDQNSANGYKCLFAFKNEADYTMLRLKWA